MAVGGLKILQHLLKRELEPTGLDAGATALKGKVGALSLLGRSSLLGATTKVQHQHLRRLVGQALTPSAVATSLPVLQQAAEEQAQKLFSSATCENPVRIHFASRYPRDSLVILEEGSLPRCERCGMHIPCSAVCRLGEARNRQRVAAEDATRAREVVFTVKGYQLQQVDTFRYLGRLSHPRMMTGRRFTRTFLRHESAGEWSLACDTRGGNTTDVCRFLPSNCAIDAPIWVRDVGCERQGL